MSSISGYGYSRGNYSQILRAKNSSRGEVSKADENRSEKADKSRSEKYEKIRSEKADRDELDQSDRNRSEKFEGSRSEKGGTDNRDVKANSNRDASRRFEKESSKTDGKFKDIEQRLAGFESRLSDTKERVDSNSNANAANRSKIEDLKQEFKSLGEALKGVASDVSGVDSKVDANARRLDDLNDKFGALSEKLAKALGGSDNKEDIEALTTQTKEVAVRVSEALGTSEENGRKIDDLRDSVDNRFDDVDSKLGDISSQLGDQVTNVSADLSTAVTELKEVIKEVSTNSDSKLADTVKDLKNDFNKQFNDLKSQHETETNALLEKLDEVTTALKTLSEQSSEQIAVLKDKLGGLGGQLGTVINKIDLLGQGQVMSHRSIGLFNAAAKVGDGALDKLIGLVGPGSTGNQLRSAQSRLHSLSARFGGAAAGGLNLLA